MLRILIVGSELLMGAGVVRILAHEGDFDLFGVAASKTTDDLLQEIRFIGADVVIVDETSCMSHPFVILEKLPSSIELTVLAVNPFDNTVCIYSKRQVAITNSDDLGNEIRHRNLPEQMSCQKDIGTTDIELEKNPQ